MDGVPAPAGVKWTCPMHPEIIRDAPGSCPICGMALEPMTPAPDSGPNPELVDMRRRFVIGLGLTAPVLILEMGRHLLGRETGSSLSSQRRSCCGPAGRSLNEDGNPSSIAA
jgi:hypothetical protein